MDKGSRERRRYSYEPPPSPSPDMLLQVEADHLRGNADGHYRRSSYPPSCYSKSVLADNLVQSINRPLSKVATQTSVGWTSCWGAPAHWKLKRNTASNINMYTKTMEPKACKVEDRSGRSLDGGHDLDGAAGVHRAGDTSSTFEPDQRPGLRNRGRQDKSLSPAVVFKTNGIKRGEPSPPQRTPSVPRTYLEGRKRCNPVDRSNLGSSSSSPVLVNRKAMRCSGSTKLGLQHPSGVVSRRLQRKGLKYAQVNKIGRLSSRLKQIELPDPMLGLPSSSSEHSTGRAGTDVITEGDRHLMQTNRSHRVRARTFNHGVDFTPNGKIPGRRAESENQRGHKSRDKELIRSPKKECDPDHQAAPKRSLPSPRVERDSSIDTKQSCSAERTYIREKSCDGSSIEAEVVSKSGQEELKLPSQTVSNLGDSFTQLNGKESAPYQNDHGNAVKVSGNQSLSELLDCSDSGSSSLQDSDELSDALRQYSAGHGSGSRAPAELHQAPDIKTSKPVDQEAHDLALHEHICSLTEPCTAGCLHIFSHSDAENRTENTNQNYSVTGTEQRIVSSSSASSKAVSAPDQLMKLRSLILNPLSLGMTHTLPSESLFCETIRVARAFLRLFSLSLVDNSIDQFSSSSATKDDSGTISWQAMPNAQFAHHQHIKFAVQALINNRVFDEFQKPSYGVDGRNPCWHVIQVEFQRLAMLTEPIQAIDPRSECYDRAFHQFCSFKLLLLEKNMLWLNSWTESMLHAFLDAMKYVWQAHLLTRVLKDSVSLLTVNAWSQFDSSLMDVVDLSHDASQFTGKVQFMVSPGFKLNGSIIKCEVYLLPKPPKAQVECEHHGM